MFSLRNRLLKKAIDTSFIMNVTGVTTTINNGSTFGPHLYFRVTSGDKPTYVTFKNKTTNRTITVNANTSAYVDFETLDTGNIEFRGGYTQIGVPLVSSGPNSYSDTAKINYIVKWYTHLDYLFDSFLTKYRRGGSYTLHQGALSLSLPSSIKKIGDLAFSGFTASKGLTLNLHSDIQYIGENSDEFPPFSNGQQPFTGAVLDNGIWVSGKYALCVSDATKKTPLVIPDYIEVIPANFIYIPVAATIESTKILVPHKVKHIPALCFASPDITPKLTSITFQQPNGFEVTFASPGSITGVFYAKSAAALEVITDNQSVANYDFKTDNRTTTFKHNDLSAWSTLSQPTISKTGDLLTINAVTNATYYKILATNTVVATITDISNAIDLTEYITTAGTYTLSVRAFADNYVGSIKSTTVSYTKS